MEVMNVKDGFDLPDIPGVTVPESIPAMVPVDWPSVLSHGIYPAQALAKLNLPKRRKIVGEWFKEGDLGFIFGQRGLGKTWLAQYLARGCAEGSPIGIWGQSEQWPVLYVDGEMALDDTVQRDGMLARREDAPLRYLHHQVVYHEHEAVLNLTHPRLQQAFINQCEIDGTKIIFLDNLSCLFSGIKENDADEWERVLPWLLQLRRAGISVVFVAHAGRNGNMRGTSRREDSANWIIQLSEPGDGQACEKGARFIAQFTKNRNATNDHCPPVEWHFKPREQEADKIEVACNPLSPSDKLRALIENGVTSATDLAEEMGISKGYASKLANRAIAAGWLRKDGREYAILRS